MKKKLVSPAVKVMVAVAVLTILLQQQQRAHAQALLAPVENFVMNRAVGGVITKVAIARGFAANDPRIAATLTGVSTGLTAVNVASSVAGIGFAVAGAPLWIGIAASLGVLAVGAAIVAGSSSVSITGSGKLQVQQPLPLGTMYSPPPVAPANATNAWSVAASMGVPIYRTASCFASDSWCSSFPAMPLVGAQNFQWSAGSVAIIASTIDQVRIFETQMANNGLPTGTTISSVSVYWEPNADGTSQRLMRNVSGSELIYNGTDYVPTPFSRSSPLSQYVIGPGVLPVSGSDLNTIYPQISQDAKNQPLFADTLARITDQAWRKAAAQPGYTGLPYSVTQPVTATDVMPWQMENPMTQPKLDDLLRPANNPGSQTVPISPTATPGTNPNPVTPPATGAQTDVNVVNTPNVNVTNNVKIDLGPDPAIGAPSLESTPTAQMILNPLLNLFPTLKNFVVPAHGGDCPKPSMTMFNKSIVLDGHCNLLETVRPTLYAVMAFVWVAIAMFIILAA